MKLLIILSRFDAIRIESPYLSFIPTSSTETKALQRFTSETMARNTLEVYRKLQNRA